MKVKDKYKLLAEDYDALNPKEEIFKQKYFFQKIIRKYSIKTCLDCACGTGWHLYMLDNLGLKCYGSDVSSKMINLAKKNLKGKHVALRIEDFRTLSKSWENKFDMIICMTTSFPHMLTDRDAITALNSMYNQLKEAGVLIISNGISDKLLNKKPKFIPARILNNQAFYFFLEYLNEKKIVFNILNIKKIKNSFKHKFEVIEYNAMRKSTLQKYFSETNFKKINYYGDYNFSKYSVRKSRRLIAIAKKPKRI